MNKYRIVDRDKYDKFEPCENAIIQDWAGEEETIAALEARLDLKRLLVLRAVPFNRGYALQARYTGDQALKMLQIPY